jgi:metal-responsive CopG/Arc/MetJ family transcriptional regulator
MARTQTMVQLNEELLTSLDAEAARLGCSRSALIRDAIVARLAALRHDTKVKAYVEGYRRHPQSDEFLLEAERRTTEVARRLDDEEAAAGLSW